MPHYELNNKPAGYRIDEILETGPNWKNWRYKVTHTCGTVYEKTGEQLYQSECRGRYRCQKCQKKLGIREVKQNKATDRTCNPAELIGGNMAMSFLRCKL